MYLFILSGNSIKNLEWSENLARVFKSHFDETKILHYRHWSRGEGEIDLEYELSALLDLTKNSADYVIFAKSAGALLALKGIYERSIKPLKCIFVGTAVLWGKGLSLDINLWLKNYSLPTLFIQKEFDPAIHYADLERLLKELNVKNYKLQKITGSDHEYNNINLLKRVTLEFIRSTSKTQMR